METRVSQAHFRQTVEVWRWNLPSKRAPLTKAGVIDQNDQDIRRASGSFGEGHCPWFWIFVGTSDLGVLKRLLGLGQYSLRDRQRGGQK
jgi:hypothetical protein